MFSSQLFSSLPLRADLLHQLQKQNITTMTHVQSLALPKLLQEEAKKEFLVLAETGSGKSLCYLLPIINSIFNAMQAKITPKKALILTTTRELTAQIYIDIKKLDPTNMLKITRLGSISQAAPYAKNFGKKANEESVFEQAINNMANYANHEKVDIIISTPTQLELLMSYSRIKNLKPELLVIDEADILMDKDANHRRAISRLLATIKKPEWVTLTAASFDRKIQGVTPEEYLRKTFRNLEVIKNNDYLKINPMIDHSVVEVNGLTIDEKLNLLQQLILSSEEQRFLVYCSTVEETQKVAAFLTAAEIPSVNLTPSQPDAERLKNLLSFRLGKYIALVCTDSVNRGIHFEFSPHVIQFSSPTNATVLLHRFGRTGRLGKKGRVTSFVTDADIPLLASFQELVSKEVSVENVLSRKRSFSKKTNTASDKSLEEKSKETTQN